MAPAVEQRVGRGRVKQDSAPATLRFRDLGPLGVERAGAAVPIAGGRLAGALSLLLIHADRPVAPDALAEAMYGAAAGPRSASTLDSHVWRLRKLLEPDRGRGEPAAVLLREPAGYRLLATAEQVDSLRFARLAGQAGDLLAGGQPDRAVRRTDEALGLWRGRPFAAVADEPWAGAAGARLEELHAQVRERQAEALLALGEPQRALLELETAIADAPLRERLWALRMLATHRSGRTDQALSAYRRVRELLRDELGIEPGAELRELHARILAEDPTLLPPRPAAGAAGAPAAPAPPAPARAPEVHLPGRLNRLVGRGPELERADALLDGSRLLTVVGAAGCGKTRLALEIARTAADRFPDGVWAVDLTAAAAPEQVLTAVASALGLALPGAGTAADALRAFTRGRRMLLVLDNCEHLIDAVADLVDDLLVEGSELTVLATSREPLDVDGEVVCPLDPLPLPADDDPDPAASPAVELFLERLAAAGPAAGEPSVALAVTICRAVDGVPLAIELAAARARAYSLAEIAQQVGADPSALARIGRGPADHHRTVRHAIEQSYRTLDELDAAVHRSVCVVPGPFTATVAGALAGLAPADVQEPLARLVHRSLLVPLGPARPGGPSRFSQLATVRGHAAHTAGDATTQLHERRDQWVGQLVGELPRLGSAAESSWFTALDDDLAAVRAALQHALVDDPSPVGVAVAARLGLYWYLRGMMVEGRLWQERATTAPEAARHDRAMVHLMLGGSLTMANRADLGLPLVRRGWDVVHGTPAATTRVMGEGLTVLAGAFYTAGQVERSRWVAERIRTIAAGRADPELGLFADVATLLARAGAEPVGVAADAERVHERAVEAGNSFAVWLSSAAAVTAALAAHDVPTAIRWSDRMIANHVAIGVGEGPLLLELRANAFAMAGDAAGAARLYAAARSHHERAGMRWPNRPETAELMRRTGDALDRVEFEQARQEGARLTLSDLGAAALDAGDLEPA
jgi:predicted ATPase/DNA-binding SARP family transcriptional activator